MEHELNYLDEARRMLAGTTALLPTLQHLLALHYSHERQQIALMLECDILKNKIGNMP
jgi:hypothetical protein